MSEYVSENFIVTSDDAAILEAATNVARARMLLEGARLKRKSAVEELDRAVLASEVAYQNLLDAETAMRGANEKLVEAAGGKFPSLLDRPGS